MKYQPIDSTKVPRFADIKTFFRLPYVKTTENIDYAIVGIPFDTATTYRPGARFGPSAIRDISSTLKPYHFVHDVQFIDLLSGVDYGDVPVITGYIEDTLKNIEDTFTPLAQAGVVPIGVGGDHSVTLGELRALAKVHGPLALIHFDAHTDTGDSYYGKKYMHGTPFKRALDEGLIDPACSIQAGMRSAFYNSDDMKTSPDLGLDMVTNMDIEDMGIDALIGRIKNRVGNRKVFLTFDIDFLEPAYAPATGTPEIGGFTSRETLKILRGLRDINFVGYDIVEVAPQYDNSQITSLMAATILFEWVSIIAYQKLHKKG
ncbi:agmatinase [Oscillibacter hominis]|uniref:Agmatinase n=1 Tax=Oscillibacter hominis TaxID=2763056 RepID=A0A7G9B359_9FIRM|nr:agmatinase [Oscillibacter hominis]QNL43990.1 agmatinase [Oscillibacter hominis]